MVILRDLGGQTLERAGKGSYNLFMRYFVALILVCTLALGFFVQAEEVAPSEKNTFSDLAESEYKGSIENLAAIGVVSGYENGEFRPEAEVNRAEFLKMVFAALDEANASYSGGCFPDVGNEWFAPYVCYARDAGIVVGYPDGFYRPAQEVTMVEAFKIALEAFGFPLEDVEGEWFYKYRDFIHVNSIFSKYEYFPDAFATRGEMAFLIDEMLKLSREEKFFAGMRDTNSAGCGVAAPSSVQTQFVVDGVTRSAITVIPQNYDINQPISLVFAFHGRTNSNERVRSYYGVEKFGGDEAIFIYPAGQVVSGGYSWSGDEDFFDVMLEEITEKYCVNLDQIYVTGHSLGAWMANSLACTRGDVIRAVATLGGSSQGGNCSGPVAVMQWHNPDDELAAFSGAVTTRDRFLKQNRCSLENISVEPSWGSCVQYQGCLDHAPVIFCPHTNDYDGRGVYYPHNWPKGMGEQVWKFFEGNM